MTKQYTQELQNFLQQVNFPCSIVLEAGAGCGKSTAIELASPSFPRNTCILSFNKSIQQEMERRLPGFVVKTFHSIAYNNLQKRLGKLKVDANKYKSLAGALLSGASYEDRSLISDIISAFQLSSEGACLATSQLSFEFFQSVLADNTELVSTDTLSVAVAIQHAYAIFIKEVKKPTAYTFDDQLWFLVHYAINKRWNLREYDLVVVDEAQDVSPIRLQILKLLSNRCIAVGDRRQSIYAFAGALPDALDRIADHYAAVRLPLSMTWRCPTSVVDWSAQILGESFLQARQGAPSGYIGEISFNSLLQSRLDHNSMVLCRINKPLVALALALLRQQIPFRLLSDFAPKLLKRVEKLVRQHEGGMASFRTAVFDYYDERVRSVDNAKVKARYEEERDCILEVAASCAVPRDVGYALQQIIDSKYGVLLTTGHKAKGLEAESVFILAPNQLPAEWVDPFDEIAMEQERNIHYVMATRSKGSLYYVGGYPDLSRAVTQRFNEVIEHEVADLDFDWSSWDE